MRAMVFDLDGTLLDTLADIASACNSVLTRYGYPKHSLAAYCQMVGNGFDLLVRRALPENLPEGRLADEIATKARAYYAAHMLEQTRPYPGLPEVLRQLQADGIKLAVLSNKPDVMTKKLIGHYFPEIDFAAVQGGLAVVPLKPNPASLLAMLQAMSVSTASACYVGDSNVDMQTAHNAKVLAVGVAWGFRGREELAASGADLILERPEDLRG